MQVKAVVVCHYINTAKCGSSIALSEKDRQNVDAIRIVYGVVSVRNIPFLHVVSPTNSSQYIECTVVPSPTPLTPEVESTWCEVHIYENVRTLAFSIRFCLAQALFAFIELLSAHSPPPSPAAILMP